MTNKPDITVIKDLISHDKWTDAIDLMIQIESSKKNQESSLINTIIINGNTPYHIACIKGKNDVIKRMIKLKSQLNLNLNQLSSDGSIGSHLYYRYGGSDPFLLEMDDMCYIDMLNNSIASYLIDNIDLLETLVNNMQIKKCLYSIVVKNDDSIYTDILNKVNANTKNSSRYAQLFMILYKELKPENIGYMLVITKCSIVLELMFKSNINPIVFTDVYNTTEMTPFALIIYTGYLEIFVMILEYLVMKTGTKSTFNVINKSDINSDKIPMAIAIKTENWVMLQILLDYCNQYIKEYESKNKTYYVFDQTDSTHSTYLHMLLSYKDITIVPDTVIEYFLDRTDLNHENYDGITSSHLIFSKGLWKKYKHKLIGKTIDLHKLDNNGINCYGYINDLDKKEFNEVSGSLKIKPIQNVLNDINITAKSNSELTTYADIKSVKNILSTNNSNYNSNENFVHRYSKKNHNHGLFNPNSIHYMIYLRYIQNKHQQLFVPIQPYAHKIMKSDNIIENAVSSYITSSDQDDMVKHVKIYQQMFYSYTPHIFCWVDNDCYYHHRNLQKILTEHNNNVDMYVQRFVLIKITIIIGSHRLHANILIYDRQQKKAWRFEPYGKNRIKYKQSMDELMKDILQSVYGDIEYNDPNSFLKDINFQTVDREDNTSSRNNGDPGGYCLAWCLWFVDTILSHPNVSPKILMKQFFSRDIMSEIVSEDEIEGTQIRSSNYYLDFIRRYARKLDDEKNIILDKIGIKRYNMYKNDLSPDIKKIITDIFKVRSN
jgi:hypothetical protein